MKRIVFSLLIATFSFSFVYAQKMSEIYPEIPDSLSLLLTKDNRIELVDNFLNSKEAKIKNKLNGESLLKELTEDYVFIQTTSKSTLEAKLLPVNEYYKIICLVQTYCGAACDSKLTFYTTDWKPLKSNSFDFDPNLLLSGGTECEKASGMPEVMTVKYKLNKDNLSLTVISTVEDYSGKEMYEDFDACLRKEIVYQWVDMKFQP